MLVSALEVYLISEDQIPRVAKLFRCISRRIVSYQPYELSHQPRIAPRVPLRVEKNAVARQTTQLSVRVHGRMLNNSYSLPEDGYFLSRCLGRKKRASRRRAPIG